MKGWIRTCQACGHRQVTAPAPKPMTTSYENSRCRKCKSEALDYGSEQDDDQEADYTQY